MDNLKILSWNICWGCMKADDTSHNDRTAWVLAVECFKTQKCLTNVAKLIDNDEYDIIGLQEAAKYNEIIDKSTKLKTMGCIHHALYIGGNTIDLTTFYNKDKFKVLAVKVGNTDTSNQDGRPYHIIFLEHTITFDKYIIINLHNGRGYNYKKDPLEKTLGTDINNLYIVDSRETSINFRDIDKKTTSDGAALFSNTFYTIVLGDFNDEQTPNENYWEGLQPFKHTQFPNLKSIVVSSITKPPVTCCTGNSLRTTGGDRDNLIGDYILIDNNNLEYIKNNEIVDYFTQHSATELSSDHKPVYAIVKTVDRTAVTTTPPVASEPATTTAPVPPPSVVLSDIGDIANYAYIWFNNSDPFKTTYETITKNEKDFIHETITKGTFPTYLQTYSDDEKEEILANEIKFVRKKFNKAGLSHITILQIPRILYDLFNLLYFYDTHPGKSATPDEIISYNCDGKTITKAAYDKYTNDNINKVKDEIFELNDIIIHFLNAHNFLDPINIVNNYKNILEWIMSDISAIDVKDRIQDSPRIDTPENIKILLEVLAFEDKPASKSILLYRGANFTKDSTIDDEDGMQFSYSLSINLSILSAFLKDQTACTINYMTKQPNDKIKYTIKKFMFGNPSPENSLFFIPPIPPYLQLYCKGELWHPRTKIGSNSPHMKYSKLGRVQGLYCYDIDFKVNFTYLESDKTMQQLEQIYQSYKGYTYIKTWRKYIKYKTKYLELKNKLATRPTVSKIYKI